MLHPLVAVTSASEVFLFAPLSAAEFNVIGTIDTYRLVTLRASSGLLELCEEFWGYTVLWRQGERDAEFE